MPCMLNFGRHRINNQTNTFSGTDSPWQLDWILMTSHINTVTGEYDVVRKLCRVTICDTLNHDEFWLAEIQDACIIGLDLLICLDSRFDMSGLTICLGNETLPLQRGNRKRMVRSARLYTGRALWAQKTLPQPQSYNSPNVLAATICPLLLYAIHFSVVLRFRVVRHFQ